jgi:hypothetical protein
MYVIGHIASINFMPDDELCVSMPHKLDINELIKSGFCFYGICLKPYSVQEYVQTFSNRTTNNPIS